MIFDDVANIMNANSALKMSKETGLSRDKIRRLTSATPFVLDYNTVLALQKLGYDIVLIRKK